MNIIFDLDGTLICSKERLYKLFNDLVPQSSLTYEEYWSLKFSRMSNTDILEKKFSFSNIEQSKFIESWMNLIEDKHYLNLDRLIKGVLSHLYHLQINHELYICTARQSRKSAIDQIDSLNLSSFFKEILVTEQKTTKEILIRKHIPFYADQDWIVGDTGKDIEAAKNLGIKSCAVLTGFMDIHNLMPYSPDKIIDSIVKFEC